MRCVADSASFSFTQAADYARLARSLQICDAVDYNPGLSLFRWNGCWATLKVQAPNRASPLAIFHFSAWRRLFEPQLGSPRSRIAGRLLLEHCTRPSCGPRRSLAGASP
jgi:hypothetical protein